MWRNVLQPCLSGCLAHPAAHSPVIPAPVTLPTCSCWNGSTGLLLRTVHILASPVLQSVTRPTCTCDLNPLLVPLAVVRTWEVVFNELKAQALVDEDAYNISPELERLMEEHTRVSGNHRLHLHGKGLQEQPKNVYCHKLLLLICCMLLNLDGQLGSLGGVCLPDALCRRSGWRWVETWEFYVF